MAFTKEQILQDRSLPSKPIDIPEWGGGFLVRTMTGRERDDFESRHIALRKSGKEMTNIRGRLCAMCLCNEDGTRVFHDSDAEALGECSAQILQKVFDVAAPLNGLTAKDAEELEKN